MCDAAEAVAAELVCGDPGAQLGKGVTCTLQRVMVEHVAEDSSRAAGVEDAAGVDCAGPGRMFSDPGKAAADSTPVAAEVRAELDNSSANTHSRAESRMAFGVAAHSAAEEPG